MKTVFLRDFKQVITKHPESWNLPCKLPRDSDCGNYLDPSSIYRVDSSLKIIEWKSNGINHFTHFDEVYITEPTEILNNFYIENVKQV